MGTAISTEIASAVVVDSDEVGGSNRVIQQMPGRTFGYFLNLALNALDDNLQHCAPAVWWHIGAQVACDQHGQNGQQRHHNPCEKDCRVDGNAPSGEHNNHIG
jgi:hypothetical protein